MSWGWWGGAHSKQGWYGALCRGWRHTCTWDGRQGGAAAATDVLGRGRGGRRSLVGRRGLHCASAAYGAPACAVQNVPCLCTQAPTPTPVMLLPQPLLHNPVSPHLDPCVVSMTPPCVWPPVPPPCERPPRGATGRGACQRGPGLGAGMACQVAWCTRLAPSRTVARRHGTGITMHLSWHGMPGPCMSAITPRWRASPPRRGGHPRRRLSVPGQGTALRRGCRLPPTPPPGPLRGPSTARPTASPPPHPTPRSWPSPLAGGAGAAPALPGLGRLRGAGSPSPERARPPGPGRCMPKPGNAHTQPQGCGRQGVWTHLGSSRGPRNDPRLHPTAAGALPGSPRRRRLLRVAAGLRACHPVRCFTSPVWCV